MFHTTTVFTSLGLLHNLCMCKQLKWEVMVASNGTDNTTHNNWQLLTMGCFSINSKRVQQYQPFFFVLAPGERQEIFGMYVVYSILKIFLGGVVNDATEFFIPFPAPNYWPAQRILEGRYQWGRVMVLTASMWTQKYSLLIQQFMTCGISLVVWMIQFLKHTKSLSKKRG